MSRVASSSKKTGKTPVRRRTTSTRIPTVRHRRRLKLRHLLFALLLGAGILPLFIASQLLISENQEVLKTQESEILTNSAQIYANALSQDLAHHKERLRQLGRGLLAHKGYATIGDRLRSNWFEDYVWSYIEDHPEIVVFGISDQTLQGWVVPPDNVPGHLRRELYESMQEALETEDPVYRFVIISLQEGTAAVVSVPLPLGEETLIVSTVVRISLANPPGIKGLEKGEVFLIRADGSLLWSSGSGEEVEAAIMQSDLISDFEIAPTLSVIRKLDLPVGSDVVETLARVVQVPETGWGVVAHKPYQQAFESVRKMVKNTLVVSVILLVLAFGMALVSARWLSQPIQQLVEASHEIAVGNFNRRVKTQGLAFEIADLAEDFNRMSDTVESYIEQLKKAAKENRDLFISTIRAFAATIDAKDPYTRGHSERVAAYSRSISRYLGLPKDVQERVWISAVLHDVGKIGVEDRILKKVGVLTPEEFEQMKLHPVIGADIVEPISALREMIPGIRWHHEAWNGTGYPDNLKGEEIPLMARIIGVADTFDAITTTRPYQNAYSTDYALQTIKKLTGKRFDPKIVTAFLLAYEAGHIRVDKEEADSATSKINVTTPEAIPARA